LAVIGVAVDFPSIEEASKLLDGIRALLLLPDQYVISFRFFRSFLSGLLAALGRRNRRATVRTGSGLVAYLATAFFTLDECHTWNEGPFAANGRPVSSQK
jgi:hypothetical protein